MENETYKKLYYHAFNRLTDLAKEIESIISLLNFSDETEVTMEMNPEFIDKKYLAEFGKRLKSLRELKGLKQREMAGIMGIKLRQYQRYEYGEIGVPLEVLNFFADYFGVTADYLLGREEKHDEQ